MSAAHTPGPMLGERIPLGFEAGEATHRVIARTPEGNDTRTVALLGGDLAEGNAQLFAAAPDLLRELQHAVRWFDQLTPSDIARYKVAIAKATGELGGAAHG